MDRKFLWLAVMLWALASIQPALALEFEGTGRIPDVYLPLYTRLVDEGFHQSSLYGIFSDPRVEFLTRTLEMNTKFVEKPEHYSRFLDPSYIRLGREFIEHYAEFIKELEARYGVPGEIMAAILLIESKLGEKRGNHRVFNVLATVAAGDNETVIDANYMRLKERFPELDRETVARRAKSRARWAYEELKSLIRLAWGEGRDVLEMKGSWAGAFGLPQFIPSSYLTYGVDGDGDGVRNLDNPYDALASVAHYLRVNGWKPGMDEGQKRAVLWKYNRSGLYVDTVLASAKLISEARD